MSFYYVLVCRECGDGDDALPIPFPTAEDRGRWAAEHTRSTGHDRWLVVDEPRESDTDMERAAVVEEIAALARRRADDLTRHVRETTGRDDLHVAFDDALLELRDASIIDAARWLRDRAESYWRDSDALLADGDNSMAMAYRTIADELRKCAERMGPRHRS